MNKTGKDGLLERLYNQPAIRVTGGLALSVFTSLFFVSFAIKPTLTTIASLKKQLSDEKQVLTLLEQKVQALKSAEDVYYQSQPYFKYLDQALPAKPEITKFATQVTYLSNQHKIGLTSLNFNDFDLVDNYPLDKKTPAQKVEINFTMSFQAPWNETKLFIENLEQLERIVNIDTVNQTAKDEIITTSLTGKLFYFPKKGYL